MGGVTGSIAGQRTSSTAAYDTTIAQTTSFEYDVTGRVVGTLLPDGGEVNQSFYPTGEKKRTWGTCQYPVEHTYSYLANRPLIYEIEFHNGSVLRMTTSKTYDSLNRLTYIGSVTSASEETSFGYLYSSANQRTKATREDGSYWNCGYDQLGQVNSGKKYFADDGIVPGMQFEYGYDSIGNRGFARSGGDENGENLREESYKANLLNQYSRKTVPGFSNVMGSASTNSTVTLNSSPVYRKGEFYRGEFSVGNRQAPVFQSLTNLAVSGNSPNADITSNKVANRFVAQTPEIYTYDEDGNTQTDGRWTYTWNGENRLIALETTSGAVAAGAPKQKQENFYDPTGRRIRKVEYVWDSGTSQWDESSDILFLYDQWNMVTEIDKFQKITNAYFWGIDLSGKEQGAGGVGGHMFADVQSVGLAISAYDGNGNISAYINASDAGYESSFEYSPFGQVVIEEGSMFAYKFSTKYEDSLSGLDYYGYRYLSTGSGRWLSRDMIDERGGMNLYGFINNDLINIVDLLGLCKCGYFEFRTLEVDERPAFEVVFKPDCTGTKCECKKKDIRMVQVVKFYGGIGNGNNHDARFEAKYDDNLMKGGGYKQNEKSKNAGKGAIPYPGYQQGQGSGGAGARLGGHGLLSYYDSPNVKDGGGTWSFETCAVCKTAGSPN
ncbi:RHS repeat-associated core domain-containing protein [Verrucomicrobia bacterium]|nr:RHS repeat-associated core domain-containing protein [Verrucomicrobiota bacterium]